MILVLAAGCERVSQPEAVITPPPAERAPRSLPGTYRLGPDNLALDDPGPETPVVWVDLECSGPEVTCRAWRPDEQEVSCELARWSGDELKLDLVRRYNAEGEDLVERWYFRGQVSELEAQRRELIGNLIVEYEPARPSNTYRVRSPREELSEDAVAGLAEGWQSAARAREARALQPPPRKGQEEAVVDPYGAQQLPAAPAKPR